MGNLRLLTISIILSLAAVPAEAAPHAVLFGNPMTVPMFLGASQTQSLQMTIRTLSVDGHLREFTTGEPHNISNTLFVVRKAFRVNDWLPEDQEKAEVAPPGRRTAHEWKWQRGDWLLVDVASGRISQLKLPDFDPFYSFASWYQDYAAYCGISDSGETVEAVVAQLGQKKPLLRQELGRARGGELPDSECAPPDWQSQPLRVLFKPANYPKFTFRLPAESAASAQPAKQ